jgi:hypothetical protein
MTTHDDITATRYALNDGRDVTPEAMLAYATDHCRRIMERGPCSYHNVIWPFGVTISHESICRAAYDAAME